MKTSSYLSTGLAAGVLEALEPRLAPAGTVLLAISNGVLTITGDGADNGLMITHLPKVAEPGANPQPGVSAWRITGVNGTEVRFNGVTFIAPFNIAAQNGIKADLKDGNDDLFINASEPDSGMVLSGALSVIGGKGNDTVNLGETTGRQLVVQGATTLDMGEGDDSVFADGDVVFGGAVTIKGGLGADEVHLLATGHHAFLKGLSVDMGAGQDQVVVQSLRFDVIGALSIKGAGELTKFQQVALTASVGNVEGVTTVSFGAGRLDLSVGGNATTQRLNGGLVVTGGSENDQVLLRGTVTVGALNVDLKNGGSLLRLEQTTVLHAGAITFKGGTGDDQFDIGTGNTLVSSGALVVGLGEGQNSVQSGTGTSVTAGGLSYTGGAGQDLINLFGTTVNLLGNATLTVGAGTNTLNMNNGSSLTANALTWTGGKGTDGFIQDNADLNLRGALTLTMGDGGNAWMTSNGADVTAAALTYTGGKDNDTVELAGGLLNVLGNMTLTLGAGQSSTSLATTVSAFVGGSLTINGGTGLDIISINTPSLRTLGNMTLALGEGTNLLVAASADMQIAGNLTITGGKGQDSSTIAATSLVVGRAVNVSLGDGTNGIALNPGTGTVGSVIYKGGTGSDGLVLGAQNGTGTTLFTIAGGVTATMGAGPGQILRLTDVLLHGNLIATLSGISTETDEVTLNQSTFNGLVNIIQGGGASTLSVHDSFMRGNFTAQLRGGADTLNLDTEAGTSAPNIWMGTLFVNMDTGIDTINIGSATNVANARNVFYRVATIDTGSEADVYAPHNNHTFFVNAELRVEDT